MKFAQLTFIIGAVAVLMVFGCSPKARYNTLSFFFDGVPEPVEMRASASGGGEPVDTPANGAGEHRAINHGPYAAKLCEACHLPGGGKLILPVEDLCLNCHVLNLQTKHIHGPVSSGGCRVCHHPHGSGKPYLLVAEPTTFCFYCHDPNEVGTRDIHRNAKGVQCTTCHNPHGSDNQYLLKYPYQKS